MKSPSSIRNGRFHPSKCRGKVQKMGVMCTHFPKMSGPNFLIILQKKKKTKKIGKRGGGREPTCILSNYGLQLASDYW
jgi:SET domain-containing protein